MKITSSVTKSFHQDRGPRYLQLPIFFFIHPLFFCGKISCCDCYFPQQIRPQTTVQLYILRDYSSVRTGFNMITNDRHTAYSIHADSLNT